MEEKKIIKEMLPDLGQIINAVPGEAFASKDAETLLIMQRRLEESDLKSNLTTYNLIFAKRENVKIEDITASAIAFVKMKVLIQEDLISFDAKSLRDLIKECRLYVDKMTNIIRLSKTHVMTADAYQKEKIERTICKNEALIEALEKNILDVEKQIERIPKPLLTEEEPDTDIDSEAEQEKKRAVPVEKNKLRLSEKVSNFLGERRNKQEIENRLKDAEKESSDTRCLEIPFYDKSLVATEVLHCKDFSCFVLLKRKENVYFGMTKNLKGNTYDNTDQSLIELTEISDEFLQFMTVDIMSDEFKLHAFSKEEKEGMQMYFNFMSKCFEKQIGITLTVSEYLNFKTYYNRLVSKVLELERNKRHDYYRALPIAEEYMVLMDSYNMIQSETKAQIIDAIISEKSYAYVENMELILAHHMVDEVAKDEVKLLSEKMIYFSDENHFASPKEELEVKEEVDVIPAGMQGIPFGYMSQIPMIQAGMMPIAGNMYFTLQCLNEDREIVDEAHFSTANMPLAMQDYNSRKAFIKRFGLVQDGRFLPLMTSEKGEM